MLTFIVLTWIAAAEMLIDCHAGQWQARHAGAIDGLVVPESFAVDPATGPAHVSNIVAVHNGDGNQCWPHSRGAFLSRVSSNGRTKLHWRQSYKPSHLHAPTGMILANVQLYVYDNTRIVACDLYAGTPLRAYTIQGAKRLNDLTHDGHHLYTTDPVGDTIHRVDIQAGEATIFAALHGGSGVIYQDGTFYAVSVGRTQHEICELGFAAKAGPRSPGLAEYFNKLDGIEALDDGSLIVCGFPGDAVWVIEPDHRTAREFIELSTPKDIGLHRSRMVLYDRC